MNCPICKFSEITENMSICPNCNSDLDFINDVNAVSKKIKANNLILILAFAALIISIFITIFTLYHFGKCTKSDENVKIIEQLKQENAELKILVTKNNNKIESNTQNVSANVNDSKKKDTTEYIVQKDDNLWIIAQKFYGDGHKFIEIANDNNIKKPNEIFIGSKLKINKK